MKVWERFEAIRVCVNRCHAGKASTRFYYEACLKDFPVKETTYSLKDIKECNADLEPTYLIRIYSEFEVTLRDYWKRRLGKRTQPKAEVLMNRIASHQHMRTDILGNAHAVRDFRNSLVHGGAAKPVTIDEAKKYLCQFLSDLPPQW
jgi:hypothetical protein